MGYGIPKILRVTKFQICKFACCCLIVNLSVIFVLLKNVFKKTSLKNISITVTKTIWGT
jgi:hypothetical protein